MFKKWRESKRRLQKLEETLLHILGLFEEVNARQFALVQYLVASGTFTADVAISIAGVTTEADVQRLLRDTIEKAQSELGQNIDFRDLTA